MANKHKQKSEAALGGTLVVRVSKKIKDQYEVMAKDRTQPNQKPVTVADIAREALVEFVKDKAA